MFGYAKFLGCFLYAPHIHAIIIANTQYFVKRGEIILVVDRLSMTVYSKSMKIADKMLYYSGLVGIVLGLTLIILGAAGVMSSTSVAIIRGSIAVVIGLGLFSRGLSAKRRAEQRLLNDAIAKLTQDWPDKPRDQG